MENIIDEHRDRMRLPDKVPKDFRKIISFENPVKMGNNRCFEGVFRLFDQTD